MAQVLSRAVRIPRARAIPVMAGRSCSSKLLEPGDSSRIRRVSGPQERLDSGAAIARDGLGPDPEAGQDLLAEVHPGAVGVVHHQHVVAGPGEAEQGCG